MDRHRNMNKSRSETALGGYDVSISVTILTTSPWPLSRHPGDRSVQAGRRRKLQSPLAGEAGDARPCYITDQAAPVR
jgi:hypothetical protein